MSRVECGMSRVEGLRHVTSGGVAACREWRGCGNVASGIGTRVSQRGLQRCCAVAAWRVRLRLTYYSKCSKYSKVSGSRVRILRLIAP